jgi:PST family polysaccharide transporter
VNEQTEVALLLAGPAFLAMLALAPWIIDLLYSREFSEAVGILRWQVLGDVLKVASWPLGFVILAAGDGRTYMASESIAIGVFVLLVALGLPMWGIVSTGAAFLGMYVICLSVVYALARRRCGFRWEPIVWRRLVLLFVAAAAVAGLGAWRESAAVVAGLLAAIGFGLDGLARLGHMAGLGGFVGKLSQLSRQVMIRTGAWRD